jgi:hypothetical protein
MWVFVIFSRTSASPDFRIFLGPTGSPMGSNKQECAAPTTARTSKKDTTFPVTPEIVLFGVFFEMQFLVPPMVHMCSPALINLLQTVTPTRKSGCCWMRLRAPFARARAAQLILVTLLRKARDWAPSMAPVPRLWRFFALLMCSSIQNQPEVRLWGSMDGLHTHQKTARNLNGQKICS